MQLIGKIEKLTMESVQCYAGIRGSQNISEMSDVPAEKIVPPTDDIQPPFELRAPQEADVSPTIAPFGTGVVPSESMSPLKTN